MNPSERPNGKAVTRAAGTGASRLFGYDVFISFALGLPPRGSRAYASDLARRLRERDYTVFFSEDEAPAGGKLDDALKVALARSRLLVVVATPGTLRDPRWVRVEVEEFRRQDGTRPIVPISIGGALQDAALGAASREWLQFDDKIWIDDSQAACDQGIVSDDTLARLLTAPKAIRASTRWRWTVAAAFGVLTVLTAAALWFAWSDRQNALLAATNEATARDNERTAKANEALAKKNRAEAVANAASALQEARRAQVAEGQAQTEAEAARRAEKRARAGQLAAESQLARSRDPALALLLAREAWSLDPTPDTRRALYDALLEPVPLPLGQGLGDLRFVDYAATGRRFAAADRGQRIFLWSAEGPVSPPPRVLQAAAQVQGLAFSPDGRQLVTLDSDARLQFWNPEDGRPQGAAVQVPGLRAGWAFAWRPDGGQIAITGYDKLEEQTIAFWNPVARRVDAAPIRIPTNYGIARLAYSPSGRQLAATVFDSIRVWDLDTGADALPPIRARAATRFVVFTDADRLVFDGPGYEATPYMLSRREHEQPRYAGHTNWVETFTASQAAQVAATGGADGLIRLWRLSTAIEIGTGLKRHAFGVSGLAFSPDGREMVSVGRDGLALRWLLPIEGHRLRVEAGAVVDDADPASRCAKGYAESGEVRISPDRRRVLTWSSIGAEVFQLLDSAGCRALGTIPFPKGFNWYWGVDWSADSRRLWIAGTEGIRAWDLARQGFKASPVLAAPQANQLATDRAGRYLAASQPQGVVRLFDLRTGRFQDLTGGHGDAMLRALAFSPDGRTLASAADNSHALWDLGTGQLLVPPTVSRGEQYRGARFVDDGRTLELRTTGPTQRWTLDAEVWADRACQTARRNLSCREWQRLMTDRQPYRATCTQWPAPPDVAQCAGGR